ncbi:MAG TPA: hypothetical protein VK813_07055 [Edaphobacter sp.]|nr:hypothetical protein [Edaphobacter sp.]
MATATSTKPPLKAIRHPAHPLALWHLLSLDAPTIAALWTWFIASANHIHLPLSSTLAMALAVWMLYAADRLMDARLIDARLMDARLADIDPTHHEDLEARHYFHHRHRTAFLTGILLASIALALLLPHLEPAAIRLYLVLGVLISGYFVLIHATHSAHRLPKEIAVGLFFAAATFIPTVARRPDLRLPLLPSALLFATLCSLNCLFIYAWEHTSTNHRAHPITRLAIRNLPSLTVLLTLSSTALALLDHNAPWPMPCATALAATILLLLHNRRRTLAPITLRAAADLALTTPILLVPILYR